MLSLTFEKGNWFRLRESIFFRFPLRVRDMLTHLVGTYTPYIISALPPYEFFHKPTIDAFIVDRIHVYQTWNNHQTSWAPTCTYLNHHTHGDVGVDVAGMGGWWSWMMAWPSFFFCRAHKGKKQRHTSLPHVKVGACTPTRTTCSMHVASW